MKTKYQDARILIVDDRSENVQLLQRLLDRAGYKNHVGITDPLEAVSTFESMRPDLVLLDLQMPDLDGFDVMAQLAPWISNSNGDYLPVLVLTADVTQEAKQRSLAMGANDFLTKPFDFTEVLLRIHNLLETRFLHSVLRNQNKMLEVTVRERTADLWTSIGQLEVAEKELRHSHEETIQRLAIAGEFRDDETARHIQRMSRYCFLIARQSGEDEETSEQMRIASQMHDVGKIGIPDDILRKPGPLTPKERSTMQKHSDIGYRILGGSKSQILQLAADIALTHHERIDGTGYPRQLSDEEIPLAGRVAAIADVFDALTTDRIYRKAFPLHEALDIMKEGRGTHFDSSLLDVFFECLPEMLSIKQEYEDRYLKLVKDESRVSRSGSEGQLVRRRSHVGVIDQPPS